MSGRNRLPAQLLHSPALLSTESEDQRNQIRDGFDEALKPNDFIEHLYVAEIATMSLEILRLRRSRTAMIAVAFRPALEKLVAELLRQPGQYAHDVESEAQNWPTVGFPTREPRARSRSCSANSNWMKLLSKPKRSGLRPPTSS
jgi:hypothetical protein